MHRGATEDPLFVRSGEFLIGGRFSRLLHGRPSKTWWKPMESSMEMSLLLRGRRLEAPSDTMRMESDGVTAPRDSRTLEFDAEEAAFPTGVVFPSEGASVVVATTRRNWGCFVFSVR